MEVTFAWPSPNLMNRINPKNERTKCYFRKEYSQRWKAELAKAIFMYFKCDANNKYLYTFVSLVDKYLHFESKNKWLFRFISFHLKKKKLALQFCIWEYYAVAKIMIKTWPKGISNRALLVFISKLVKNIHQFILAK